MTGAALGAYLPTLIGELGFEGANAQIATLAPFGSAAVATLIVAFISDRYHQRGWLIQLGMVFSILGFGIYLGAKPTMHAARFTALILAEIGHYSESRTSVALTC